MKNLLWIMVIVALVTVGAGGIDQEVVNVLRDTNKQLARIATSLEKISGQQPGGAVPVK